MSDTRPPLSDGPGEASSWWHRYRTLPLALQILIPVLIAAVATGAVVWATGGSGSDSGSSDTTVEDDASLDEVLKGIIVVGGLERLGESTTTESTPAGTSAASVDPTEAPATSAPTVETDAPATTAPTVSEAPISTDAPVDTDPPATTDAPSDTDAPATTDAPSDTDAPATTASPSSGFPTTAAFVERWNDASDGTTVPTISAAQATELTGDFAGYYLITLSPATGNRLPPQVGVLGTLTSPGSGQLEEVVLVWIPGADEGASEFYWEAFAVLTQAISPDITAAETAALETSLGRGPDRPPFTTTSNASSHGFDYRAFSQPYVGDDGPVDVSAISVT